ncbi:MAG: response regulator [Chloroflexi bacterium]|nr:MAG: response regulator [Chloroflexota bacterium]
MSPHLLIVDDEPQVVFFLHQVLKSTRPDCVVSTALTGQQALQIAQSQKLDLMIIDYQLKDMDGLTLMATLGEVAERPSAIMITAGPLPAMAGEVESGVLYYIQKPFSMAQLTTAVNEVLDTKGSASSAAKKGTAERDGHPRESIRGNQAEVDVARRG